jgi:ATP-dependent helicase/nuclease subunit B
MAGERLLWTGPYGAALRDYALAGASTDPTSLWLVPSPIARDQVRRELAIRSSRPGPGPRVWCWSDLWKSVRGELEGGRVCLSDGAARAVFGEAVRQARQAGALTAIASVIDWPGYRRQLRDRLAGWTADEKRPRDPAPENPVAASEWAVFTRYRTILRQLSAEDATGFAVWVTHRLSPPPPSLASLDQVTFLDWEAPSRAQWRILEYAMRTAQSVRVTLAYESGPSSGPVYEANAKVRDRLRELDFDEVPVPQPDIWRPAGLRAVERALFRQDSPGQSAAVSVTQGLVIRGAPQGEGAGRLLAREIRGLLDGGADPEEILVLFPEWSEQADIALEIAHDWGLPIHAEPTRPLAADPAVAALLLAIGLPVEDWVTDHLIRLLRNGQVRPDWPGADPYSLAASASVIKTSSVFRGREPLLRWLDRTIANEKGRTVKGDRARVAREVVTKLFALLAPLDQPRPFAEQVDQLFRIAGSLRLGTPDGAGLDPLRDALEDQADILDRLGRGELPWRWSAFVREVESIVLDLKVPVPPPRPGSVRMATVGQAEGARAAFIILADLAELTFPAGDAVEAFLSLRPGVLPDEASRRTFSREMLRFLRILGSAESAAVLIYPTTNAKGQELLRAGFLDELMELLTPEAVAACHTAFGRVDPALVDSPELAGSSGDRRVRATALARTRGDLSALSAIAGRPAHRRILEGTAAALQVLASRLRGSPFGEYDGLLKDGNLVLNIAESFDSSYRFSASQLETYIACPFQFFCRYVLKLEPTERRDEIDEDYTERGSRIHNILQQLEEMKQHIRDDETPEDLARIAIGAELNIVVDDASEVDLGLAEIERRRLIQTMERYVVQLREYDNDPNARAIPHRFEVGFGADDSIHRHLEIGRGPRMVKLQGKIDRIDLVETPEGRGFRVIDYKSGAGPSATEVRKSRMLQLPLYAMAVEQIILADQAVTLRDVGYWALKKDGYKPIAFSEWRAVQEALESYVAELVDRLRRGIFVVDSQVDGCEGFCDYRAICRIRQARLAAKHHDRAVAPELAVERARGARKRT